MHGTYNRKLIKNIREKKKKDKVRQELYNCKKEHWLKVPFSDNGLPSNMNGLRVILTVAKIVHKALPWVAHLMDINKLYEFLFSI